MPLVEEPTVIAVDWSGARGPAQRNGIWVAIVRDGDVVASTGGHSREEATAIVAEQPGPVLAGFDFSFGVAGVVRARERLRTRRRCLGARGS